MSSLRRNFIHNCIVHPLCGLIWLVADVSGLLRLVSIKTVLVSFGERIHHDH